jgi:hypothetical protein
MSTKPPQGGQLKTRRWADKTHPKSLVEFIMEAIDEVAPGRGAEIYWLAFRRFNEYVEQRQRPEAETELARAGPLPEEWTVW